jgi:two-component system sensor histidine kinase DegS
MRKRSGQLSEYIAVAVDISERVRHEQNRQYYISEVTKAHEEERRLLACELHDETIQSLVALSLDVEAMQKEREGLAGDTTRQLKSLQNKTTSIIADVRRLIQELRPTVLDQLGLLPAVELLVRELNQKMINTSLTINGSNRRLSTEAETVLFRITQEALRNVWKHAHATESNVTIDFDNDKVEVAIIDNGIGFDLVEQQNHAAGNGKFGLIGMEERASLISARFSIQSQPGKGTTVSISV